VSSVLRSAAGPPRTAVELVIAPGADRLSPSVRRQQLPRSFAAAEAIVAKRGVGGSAPGSYELLIQGVHQVGGREYLAGDTHALDSGV
jgi:hypothetical protein